MSASEMHSFVKYLPLFIGEFIPKHNKTYNFLINLIKIIDNVTSKTVTSEKIILIKSLIKDHHRFYTTTCKLKLKPKHHFMVHYTLIMEKSGPLINIWCM